MLDVLKTIVAGGVATFFMTLVLWLIHRSQWANADMIRALGSLLTRRYEDALRPGLLIHFSSGVVFAFPYAIIIRGAGIEAEAALPGLGLLLGLFHGVVMSFTMLALVAENHPVPRFQNPGFEVAAAHVVAHLAYGVAVGLCVMQFGIDFGVRF